MARPKALHNRTELIIDAADQLFARYGYERTSMDDIARHLGIGKGSIYLDFRTKEEILITILKRYVQRIFEVMQQKVEKCSGSPLMTLKEMTEEQVTMVFDRVTRDIHTPEALVHTSIHMKNRFSDFFKDKRRLILKLLVMAADAGEISRDNAREEIAQAFMMGTCSLFPPYLDNFSEAETRVSRNDLRKRAKLLIQLLISGLREAG